MKKLFYLINLNLLLLTSVIAQNEQLSNQLWVNGGIGQSVSEAFTENAGLAAGAGVVFSHQRQLISLQMNRLWETNMGSKMQGSFNEWKIQYGYIQPKKDKQFYVMGGLGYTECNHFKEVFQGDGLSVQKEHTTETSFGFVAETGINFILNKHIGIGIASFANLNKNALSAGYSVRLLLGLFRGERKK